MGRSRTTIQARRVGLLATLLCVLAAGCVERRVLVRTNPPGATLYVDDNEVGLTPVPFSPIYYGDRKIRLVKDGYETLTVIQPMPPPWYEVPPLDFFSENVVPGKLRDMRTLDYQLRPLAVVPKEELLNRAESLRHGTQTITGVAAPGYRVNPPSTGQAYVPPAGAPGGPPIGGQPFYQLPPGAANPVLPPGSSDIGPPASAPIGPPPSGTIYQPPPSLSPSAPTGPSAAPGTGSQPYYPLPSGG